MGAVLTQRPDLVGAVVCTYPLLDMLRYHQFPVARFGVSEYGSGPGSGAGTCSIVPVEDTGLRMSRPVRQKDGPTCSPGRGLEIQSDGRVPIAAVLLRVDPLQNAPQRLGVHIHLPHRDLLSPYNDPPRAWNGPVVLRS